MINIIIINWTAIRKNRKSVTNCLKFKYLKKLGFGGKFFKIYKNELYMIHI